MAGSAADVLQPSRTADSVRLQSGLTWASNVVPSDGKPVLYSTPLAVAVADHS